MGYELAVPSARPIEPSVILTCGAQPAKSLSGSVLAPFASPGKS